MRVRQVVLVTHRWIGLSTSVVLAIVGATGVALLWREQPFWEQHQLLVLGGRAASKLHERLAFGLPGSWIVVTATGLSILLELGGIVLWWKRKTLWVKAGRGWWRACFDLHHLTGAIFLPVMLLLAVTGFVMGVLKPVDYPELWRFMARLHRGQYPFPIDAIYALASLGFALQGLTGVAVWWKPLRPRADNIQGPARTGE